ncbi:MAG: DUF502 domain-containing protein [Candidatus Omnitrophica bacterium]|nr:DUF502 domain-containing protein [Candidatus Omnitrophota bacterium]
MKKFLEHCKMYVFRGILAVIPIALSAVTIAFIYKFIDKKVSELIDQYIGFKIPGVGVCVLFVCLYVVGLIASNVFGKRFIHFFESILDKIPIIKTTYQVGKQVSNTLSMPEKQVFQKVVLVDYFKPGAWVIGFVTGSIINKEKNEKLLKVFIPTVPNPTSGFLVILKESQTIDPQWSIEEAMKMVISGGIIGPEFICGKSATA